MNTNKLIIIGAGPKGLAIAAKNKVLRDLGLDTPEVILIEKSEIAANWTGRRGFTNGKMTLGTGPEKDIGYPYDTREFSETLNKLVNQEMLKFSWTSYLIASGKYSDFIDRGKPFPKHKEYADYLRWVRTEVADSVELIIGKVIGIDTFDEKVIISYSKENHESKIVGDGLMMTGPGIGSSHLLNSRDSRVLDIEKFWMSYKKLNYKERTRIGIVGAGENSASIALALGELNHELDIDVITPAGFIFTRGESYFENRVYSDPELGQWDMLSDEDKRIFIKRTDLGVFGYYAQTQLNHRRDISIIPGRVQTVISEDKSVVAKVIYNGKTEAKKYDYIIIATGFDQVKLLHDLASTEMKEHLKEGLKIKSIDQVFMENFIGRDMALEGILPKVHLPMISRMRQGPGFANLSSLGRLSDHVLSSYVGAKELSKEERLVCYKYF
jgi:mycobactin lysine-N-oxygenase